MQIMTVADLRSALENFDDETPVHFAYNYGDHWHTIVAPGVVNVEEGAVRHSAYHNMPRLVDDEDDADEEKTQTQSAVIISA